MVSCVGCLRITSKESVSLLDKFESSLKNGTGKYTLENLTMTVLQSCEEGQILTENNQCGMLNNKHIVYLRCV